MSTLIHIVGEFMTMEHLISYSSEMITVKINTGRGMTAA